MRKEDKFTTVSTIHSKLPQDHQSNCIHLSNRFYVATSRDPTQHPTNMLREPQTPPTEPEPASPHELARGLQARAAQDLHDLEARYMAAFKLQAWWRRRRAAHVYTTKGAAFLKIIQRDTVRSLSWDVLTSRLSSEGTLELAQDLLSAVRISIQHHHRK